MKNKIIAVFLGGFFLAAVALTGWVFSPFFFTVYLLLLFLSFVFPAYVSLAVVSALMGALSYSLHRINLIYGISIIASLAADIPLGFYLKREYLRLKESEKEVLILKETKEECETKVDEILENKVSGLAVELRELMTGIKQMVYRLRETREKGEVEECQDKIITATNHSLEILEKFEKKATGEKPMATPKTS